MRRVNTNRRGWRVYPGVIECRYLGWREWPRRAHRESFRTHDKPGRTATRHAGRLDRMVRRVDAGPPRRPRARSIAAQGPRGVPASRRAMEPLEGPQEAGGVAAVPRLLLRPDRP